MEQVVFTNFGGQKDLFRSRFWGVKYWTSFCNYLDAARRYLQFEYSRSQNGLRMRKIHLFYWTVHKTDSNPNSTTRLSLDRSEFCFFLLSYFSSHFFFLFISFLYFLSSLFVFTLSLYSTRQDMNTHISFLVTRKKNVNAHIVTIHNYS